MDKFQFPQWFTRQFLVFSQLHCKIVKASHKSLVLLFTPVLSGRYREYRANERETQRQSPAKLNPTSISTAWGKQVNQHIVLTAIPYQFCCQRKVTQNRQYYKMPFKGEGDTKQSL